jgi:CRP-like cAMP-binding protein
MRTAILEAARRNRVLGALPPEELCRVSTSLRLQFLPRGAQLHEQGRPVAQVYFPVGCVVAALQVMRDGRSAQAATIGSEGVVGLGALSRVDGAAVRTVVQIAGEALCATAAELRGLRDESPALAERLQRYQRFLLTQVMRAVGCNQLHSLSQRLCRHLLALRDASGADVLAITQEFLAEMLGSQRPRINRLVKQLEEAGALRRRRGELIITDVAKLERGACDCHLALREEFERLMVP